MSDRSTAPLPKEPIGRSQPRPEAEVLPPDRAVTPPPEDVPAELIERRYQKFRKMGSFLEPPA